MAQNWNVLQWDGARGHYEAYYLTLTDRASGQGLWIRYTMVAPLESAGEPATCALWLLAMSPDETPKLLGRKQTLPIGELVAEARPFRLRIGAATLDDRGMRGAIDDVAWDLHWEPAARAYEHVHPLLRRARVAKTVLTLPHADLAVSGTVTLPDGELALEGARGGQAHLWGAKHASRWAWAHCNDFDDLDGTPRPGSFVDGVSVFVPRLGRELGPNTPVVGHLAGADFGSTSPVRVLRNSSRFTLTGWTFEAIDGDTRIAGEVTADRDAMVGVTYHDPDGERAYCYNSEVASMRLNVFRRDKSRFDGWRLVETLVSDGTTHFEYAQREPLPGMELHTR
jgi:hypothetical protein